MVFDREGYSPNFFVKMKDRRIACLTYRKYPSEDWPQQEFFPTDVRLSSGQLTSIRLAERGTWLGDQLWVREVRKLTESGHQTAVLSTDYKSSAARLGPAMFARWSQENFFRYMRQSYNLDALVDYGTDIVPDATMVVNPAYRTLDGQARKKIGVLNRKIAEFGAVNLEARLNLARSRPSRSANPICKTASRRFKKKSTSSRLCEKPPNDIFRIKSCPRAHGSIA